MPCQASHHLNKQGLPTSLLKTEQNLVFSSHFCTKEGIFLLEGNGGQPHLKSFSTLVSNCEFHLKSSSAVPRDRASPFQVQQAGKIENSVGNDINNAVQLHLAIAPCRKAAGRLKGESSSPLEQPWFDQSHS